MEPEDADDQPGDTELEAPHGRVDTVEHLFLLFHAHFLHVARPGLRCALFGGVVCPPCRNLLR